MCGVMCIWRSDASTYSDLLPLLSHRGPDDSGTFMDEEAGLLLGHTRLSIQDTSSRGHQPMFSEAGDCVISFNGEIYNFRELRSLLKQKGCIFRSGTDTEVLLEMYCQFGRRMLTLLNGIFAFVIWDKKKKELFVARDSMGVKPFYITSSSQGLAIASELRVLMPFVDAPPTVTPQVVHRYLLYAWGPGGKVPMESVIKMDPGVAFVLRDRKVMETWHWGRWSRPAAQPWLKTNRKEVSYQLHTKLREAVHKQMVSDVPVGGLLSGGLDSSAITYFAREINPDFQCFTIDIPGGPDSGGENDLPYARRVARELRVPLEVVTVGPEQIRQSIEKMIYMLEEPQADLAALNIYYLAQSAGIRDIKVLLSGVGGDDLFSGYRRHYLRYLEPVRSRCPDFVWTSISSMLSLFRSHHSLIRRLRTVATSSVGDVDSRLIRAYFQIAEEEVLGLYSPEIRAQINDRTATEPILEFLGRMPRSTTVLQKLLAIDQRFFLADHNLNYTDKMSMASGVEIRVPFLDEPLVDFAEQIPDQLKQSWLTNKKILRQALSGCLPKEVLQRPKTGFGLPVRRWIRNELREMVFDYLSSYRVREREIFDHDAVENLIIKNDRGQIDAGYTIFALLCFEIWCQLFLDRCDRQHEVYKTHFSKSEAT